MAARKEEAEKKLTVAKEKYEWQLVQTEGAREAQAVLDHMLTTRQVQLGSARMSILTSASERTSYRATWTT